MQVLLNTNPHTDGRQAMAEYLEAEVAAVLGHYGERITRVEAHLSDANSPAKANTDESHCTLEARLVGLDPVVVKIVPARPIRRSTARSESSSAR